MEQIAVDIYLSALKTGIRTVSLFMSILALLYYDAGQPFETFINFIIECNGCNNN